MNFKTLVLTVSTVISMEAQNVMTPEKLWTLNKFSVSAISPNHNTLIYNIGKVNLETEKTNKKNFTLNFDTYKEIEIDLGKKSIIQWDKNGLYAQEGEKIFLSKDAGNTWIEFYTIGQADNIVISPDGKKIAFSKSVKVENILGKNKFNDTPKSTAQIYRDLNHRHWDTWNEGYYNHIFVVKTSENISKAKDILDGQKFDSPQKPFGGTEDFIWSPDSETLLYVCKKKSGADYAQSTNTDIYAYNLQTHTTENITKGMMGYDVNPRFSPDGKSLLWQSMQRDGYEADKNDIIVMDWKTKIKNNITKNWNESVTGTVFWATDSKSVYFNAAYRGTVQLFSVNIETPKVKQITKGNFDITGIVGQYSNKLFVTRTDINHSADLYSVDLKSGSMAQITNINKSHYDQITTGKSELKMVKTSDGKDMGVWFHYPPNFDPNKKYPVLLYCQGGPQSALTQFFSLRWNFALMAANGYIVVAPNRRGMPGWGTEWNEAISRDWGGQPMKDYLAATDYAKTLPFVDSDRIAAVGASYGGYSVFMLAGIHQNRFKTFIAHNGLYNMQSWYGNTEELWFANWDIGKPWEVPTPKAYTEFDPSKYIEKWNRPIMIIQGGKDYRVPIEQGLEAFQRAKLRGLNTKLVYFPDENHWILRPQNALVWQREFFEWLKETL